MNGLLKDLEAVAVLADKATPGEWVTTVGHHVKQAHGVLVVAKNELRGEEHEHNAAYIAAVSNMFRTHHAKIAEAVKDARRYRWLRSNACDGFMRADGGSLNCDEPESEWDAWIDASMNNSAREDGE